MGSGVFISLDWHSEGGYQVSVDAEAHGYRIFGPKYDGSSERIKRHELTASDIRELRSYLNEAARNLRKKKTP